MTQISVSDREIVLEMNPKVICIVLNRYVVETDESFMIYDQDISSPVGRCGKRAGKQSGNGEQTAARLG